MSLSVTALLAAAVEIAPDAVVATGGQEVLTLTELDRRSRATAGGVLLTGGCPGSAVRVAGARVDRIVGLFAAWRIGLVVHLGGPGHPPLIGGGPLAGASSQAARNLLAVAESAVWSQTLAVVTARERISHGDLIRRLGPVGDPAEAVRVLGMTHGRSAR